jgi:nitroreductase
VDDGLGALLFGLFAHEAAVLAAFGVPAGRRALGTVALGHPAPDEPGRSADRPRRPLADIVHRGRW